MENGHVEIHDPFSGCNGFSSNMDCDPKPTDLSDPESTEDMVEFKILMAYAKRRRRQGEDAESTRRGSPDAPNGNLDSHGTPSPQTPDETEEVTEKKKKKKKGLKRFAKFFTCFKPQIKEDEPYWGNESHHDVEDRCLDEDKMEQQLEAVANRLAKISDEIPFVHPEVETDAPDDDVEKVIGLLLRDAGDKLNESELKAAAQLLVNYSFFEKVVMVFLKTLGLWTSNTEDLGPRTSTETQIAVTCEVTSRLSVLETLPNNRLLRHGAQYLKTHYSPWAEQQGGYDKVCDSEDEGDVQ